MADEMKVSGPVTIRSDSRERIAFEMMKEIAYQEQSNDTAKRDYWFQLYHECFRATLGYTLEDIKKNSKK